MVSTRNGNHKKGVERVCLTVSEEWYNELYEQLQAKEDGKLKGKGSSLKCYEYVLCEFEEAYGKPMIERVNKGTGKQTQTQTLIPKISDEDFENDDSDAVTTLKVAVDEFLKKNPEATKLTVDRKVISLFKKSFLVDIQQNGMTNTKTKFLHLWKKATGIEIGGLNKHNGKKAATIKKNEPTTPDAGGIKHTWSEDSEVSAVYTTPPFAAKLPTPEKTACKKYMTAEKEKRIKKENKYLSVIKDQQQTTVGLAHVITGQQENEKHLIANQTVLAATVKSQQDCISDNTKSHTQFTHYLAQLTGNKDKEIKAAKDEVNEKDKKIQDLEKDLKKMKQKEKQNAMKKMNMIKMKKQQTQIANDADDDGPIGSFPSSL